MSLVRTLAKVAMGVAVAKGVSHVTRNMNDGVHRGPRQNELGGLGGMASGGGLPAGSPLAGMLGRTMEGMRGSGGATSTYGTTTSQTLSGGQGMPGTAAGGAALGPGMRAGADHSHTDPTGMGAGRGSAGGLGELLGSLGGGRPGGTGTGLGGLASALGDALSGQGSSRGGLGALLGGGAAGGGLGALLNQALQGGGREPQRTPSREEEDAAAVLLAAMIQAMKADGHIDSDERQRLMEVLGEVDADERRFVEEEMQRPVDAEALARRVPKGMERQVYTASALSIDPDTEAERRYLAELRAALGLPDSDAREAESAIEHAF